MIRQRNLNDPQCNVGVALCSGLTLRNIWRELQVIRPMIIEVHVIIVNVAGKAFATRVLRDYVVPPGAAVGASPVVTRDKYEIISAYCPGAAVPEVQRGFP